MNSNNPLLAIGLTGIESIVHPIVDQGLIPSNLPSAGIAVALVFTPNPEISGMIIARFCHQIAKNGKEIHEYIKGMNDESWQEIHRKAKRKVRKARGQGGGTYGTYNDLISGQISKFPDLQNGAKGLVELLKKIPPESFVHYALAGKTDNNRPSLGRIHQNQFVTRIVNGLSVYTNEFIRKLDNYLRKSILDGKEYPPVIYGPVGDFEEAEWQVRNSLVKIAELLNRGANLQEIYDLIRTESSLLDPIYIYTDKNQNLDELNEAMNKLNRVESPLLWLEVIAGNPILVSGAGLRWLMRRIEIDRDQGGKFEARLMDRWNCIKSLRSDLIETTSNFDDVPSRLDYILQQVNEIRQSSDKQTLIAEKWHKCPELYWFTEGINLSSRKGWKDFY